MYQRIQPLDKDHIGSSPQRATTHQAPLLTRMATGLRDSRPDRRRMIREPDEVLRAKRKLMAAMNQSDTSIGLRRQAPGFLKVSGSQSFQEGTSLQADGIKKDICQAEKIDTESELDTSDSLAVFDLESDKVVHYATVADKTNESIRDQLHQIQAKILSDNKPGSVHDQMENLSDNTKSLRYYEGQSVKFFPYLGPEKKQKKDTNSLEVKQQKISEVHDIKDGSKESKKTKNDTKKKNKRLFKGFPKTQWAKVYPINLPDDLKPRTKEDLARIAAMFCVQTRKDILSARPSSAKTAQQIYADDSDDDECFRPGVWGCEFADENLAKADVDYYNVDLDIPELINNEITDIEEEKTKEVVKHVDASDEKMSENKKSRNAFVRFFRRLFGIK